MPAEKATEIVDRFITGTNLGEIGAGLINDKLTVYDLLDSESKLSMNVGPKCSNRSN